MSHHPIVLKSINLTFPQKNCFSEFSTQIPAGSRIAIIGQNGTGKTSMLRILQGRLNPTNGTVLVPNEVVIGYVPQTINGHAHLSGGERFNKSLSEALAMYPDILILDEPTNHLDLYNRQTLIRYLRKYRGTLFVVSHDVEILRKCVDTFWLLENGKVRVFNGSYDDLLKEVMLERSSLQSELNTLEQEKKKSHQKLMREQERAKKSRVQGEKHIRERKWPTIVSDEKMRRAVETAGRKKRALNQKREDLVAKLDELRLREIITPTFSLRGRKSQSKTIVTISEGIVAYEKLVLTNINLSIMGAERVALRGDNASGKTTLVKAILNDPGVRKDGKWLIPKKEDIGYLDQHYASLDPNKSVVEILRDGAPSLTMAEARKHLNTFLFRKNEEVMALSSALSGGEKARLSLALIAAKTPRLLILDEATNNLDLETREHVIQVLKEYPGALLLISHDEDFLEAVGVETFYDIEMWR